MPNTPFKDAEHIEYVRQLADTESSWTQVIVKFNQRFGTKCHPSRARMTADLYGFGLKNQSRRSMSQISNVTENGHKSGRYTVCFNCKHAVPNKEGRGCNWSKRFEPVEGWNAIPTKIACTNTDRTVRYIDSYKILFCPEFEKG